MKIEVRTIQGKGVFETYITAAGTADEPLAQQAEEIFAAVADVLKSKNARILQERIFGAEDIFEVIRPIRKTAYGTFDDSVEPTWLVVPQGVNGKIAGVQIHAGGGDCQIEVVRHKDTPCGRVLQFTDGRKCIALNGISAARAGDHAKQASAMLEKAEAVLKQTGTDMFSVVRTWMWLKDVLAWYDKFNGVRNRFFIDRGLITKGPTRKMPASTGIGVGPADGGMCAMDLISVSGPGSAIDYLDVTHAQKSAYEYGSAFSRATRATTAAGKTVFVSGTASIDTQGTTTHLDDAEAQIKATIENVRTVLKEMNCSDDNIVQAIVYCKTPEIEKLFYSKWADFSWPYFTAITDVCRDNLLFEIEATAVRGS
jgi:enamine deaminase RidA (YjgF/YER057c/UK114 family)